MVSYAELCQAIERWQRSQGRVTALESALQQAMWRGFITHHAPDLQMEFQGDSHLEEPAAYEQQEAAPDDQVLPFEEAQAPEDFPYAATGS